MMGVAGVGKTTVATTLAERLGWTFAEGDDFHPTSNVEKMRDAIPLTDADRAPWLRAIAAWIGEQEQAGRSAVVACSALKRRYRRVLADGHPSVRFVHLVASPPVVATRMRRRRGHFMPPELQASQAAALEPLEPGEPGLTVDAEGGPDRIASTVLDRLGFGG